MIVIEAESDDEHYNFEHDWVGALVGLDDNERGRILAVSRSYIMIRSASGRVLFASYDDFHDALMQTGMLVIQQPSTPPPAVFVRVLQGFFAVVVFFALVFLVSGAIR